MWTGNFPTRERKGSDDQAFKKQSLKQDPISDFLSIQMESMSFSFLHLSGIHSASNLFTKFFCVSLALETMLCAPIQACSSVHTHSVLKLLPFLQVNYLPSKCRVFEGVNSLSCK
jgi:hypothetical protein